MQLLVGVHVPVNLHDEFMVDVDIAFRVFGVDEFVGALVSETGSRRAHVDIHTHSTVTETITIIHSGAAPFYARLMSSGHHISMEHRLWRKLLLFFSETDACN